MTQHEPEHTPVQIEIEVSPETAGDIEAWISQQGLERGEALRLLLGSGLGYQKVVTDSPPPPEEDSGTEAELKRLLARLIDSESRLAATRWRMFELQGANQAWELSTGAIRAENVGMRAVAERLRAEVADLRAQLESQTAELNALRAAHVAGRPGNGDQPWTGEAVQAPSRRHWLRRTPRG